MKPEKLLAQLGFSRNESRVYLAALECGVSSAQDIAVKAGLQRTTTYSVLGQLVIKGLMAKTKTKGKSRFIAEDPDKLKLFIKELHSNLNKLKPEFDAIYNKSQIKPKIFFYEGRGAIQKVYNDTLAEKPREILEWNTNAYFENPMVDEDYVYKRIALNISAKRIAGNKSMWETKHRRRDEKELSQTVIVPKEIFSPEIEVNIYNNKVAFMNYAENMSVIIESEAIASAMRQVYNLSWEGAKKLEVK